jgi:uncharacterized protein YukJ
VTLKYGCLKCNVISAPKLKASRHEQEMQYHIHALLRANGQNWDTAINVGTNDADDLLKYRLVYDFHHSLIDTVKTYPQGFHELTGTTQLPALDFLRSDILVETGSWRDSGVMDGTSSPEPVAGLITLLEKARETQADVYVFGRAYTDGTSGVHDIHMNQGSKGDHFLNDPQDPRNDEDDHNDVWQDGGLLVDLGQSNWAGYFTAFTQQCVPTDPFGNPQDNGTHPIQDSDDGSLAQGS